MNELTLTCDERAFGLAGARLQLTTRALREDGFVILHEAVDAAHIHILRDKMLSDVATILARPDAPFNFNAGNVQQDPPPHAPLLFRDILFNEAMISLTHAVLGDGLFNSFYSGNTAVPGGTRQPVHPDYGQLWPDLAQATPPYCIAINVPLVDFTAENGATELWLGTHLDTTPWIGDPSIRVEASQLDKWRERGPIRAIVPAGSLIVRDLRMWHAGMPNQTDTPRPMIAMIHFVSWWKDIAPSPFPESAREFLQHPILKINARFVQGEVNYLAHNAAYDLDN